VQHKPEDGRAAATARADRLAPNSEFARGFAHELGNLLQVVNGNLELLSARIDDPDMRRYLANAQTAAQQLTELMHTLVERRDQRGGG
jgi:signal transduction histidine kinase